MHTEPLVSVIIPAFNAEKTIRNAIDSVLKQTMPHLEVVVVDDASTDGTTRVVESIVDGRVRLLKSERNLRPAGARNLAIRLAKGHWVAILDADDEWVPDRLENMLRAAQGAECFVADWFASCRPASDGRLKPLEIPLVPTSPFAEDFDFTDFLRRGRCVFLLAPRAAFEHHHIVLPEWSSGGETAYLVSRLSACGLRGKLVNRVGYLYRVTGSHDGSTLRSIEEQLRVQEFLAGDPEVPEEARTLLRRGVPGIRKRLVVAALRERRWGKLARYARQNPVDILTLPGSVFRFLRRKAQYWKASRNTAATEDLG